MIDFICKILDKLYKERAQYQAVYKKIHGTEDKQADIIYDLLISQCIEIRREATENNE